MSIERKSSDRRKLRAGMVFVLVVAGTALIGWGGLAAWQAVTQNNGSTASTLGVHMQNVATVTGDTSGGVPCTDQNSPGNCGAVFDVSGLKPGWGATQVGTVTITNTGTEPSTFNLELTPTAMPTVSAAPSDTYWTSANNSLCYDLQLTVTDSQSHTYYSGRLSQMNAVLPISLYDSNTNTTWLTSATDTFKFTLSLPLSSPNTDEDSTCIASFTWGQNGV
jgi:hypothetical protein